MAHNAPLVRDMVRHHPGLASLLVMLAAMPASAQPQQLALAWEYPTPGVFPQALVVDQMGRPCLHVALKNGGLAILDISKPDAAPKQLAALGTAQFGGLDVMHLTQHKDLLVLALGDFFNAFGAHAGFAVVSVAKPSQPKVLSVWKSKEKLHGAAMGVVKDKYAYLGAMEHGVFIFDISDPKKIDQVAALTLDLDYPRMNPNKVQRPNARGLALKDKLLYVAFDAGGVRVVDIANPLKPKEIGRYTNPGMAKKQAAYNNLVIDGTTAYAAVDYAGMEVLDISAPKNIKLVAWWNPWEAHLLKSLWFNSAGHTNQLEFDAKKKLVYLSAGDSDLVVLDVADRTRPKLAAQYGGPKDKLGVWGLTLGRDYVYLAYITASVPFQGTWAGIKAVRR